MTPTSAAPRDFRHTRMIPAAPAAVFHAIVTPERLARWWGPEGFRSTFEVCDVRPGGEWRFVLHGPDGGNYPNHNVFRDVVPDTRVVVDHIDDAHHFVLTVTLEARDGGTLVGWHQLFDSADHRAEIAQFVEPANEQNLDRLAAEVARGG